MANFELIKEHPYITAGVVIGGGVLLWLYWSSGSSSSSASTTTGASGATTGETAADPNVLAAQVQSNSASLAAQLGALQANDQLQATVTGYAESGNVSIVQSNNTLAATLAQFETDDYSIGAQQQVANASIQSQVQLAEVAKNLPLTYTMAAGGPFSAQYSGSYGGTVPTSNPSSNPSQVVSFDGSGVPSFPQSSDIALANANNIATHPASLTAQPFGTVGYYASGGLLPNGQPFTAANVIAYNNAIISGEASTLPAGSVT